ncbi:aldehyde dehydrogenase domain-containing protein [Syncephalastrum racemosum]|uniref:Aldehyde dehydrogenase domain-containing protein n=1 Tax=Syncephalastrum racemosum TaxID=13706 RepID=A0A1X2H527_SYNRA|nr:aldehyde dehydrogenase domain-containing protein [Syncephalastrum racemosum]
MAPILHEKVILPTGKELELDTGLFINNEFVPGAFTIDATNPYTGKVIASVHAAREEEVNQAVEAAEKAYKGVWGKTTPRERSRLLNKLADLVERDREEIAQIETLNNGKPLSASRMIDTAGVIELLRYFAGWTDKHHGKVIDTQGTLSYTRHEPLGVIASVLPWNYPLLMMAMKLTPALSMGNTIVFKTSELTPLSALKIAALIKEAGFPAGVVNVVTGYGHETGEMLSRHMKVHMVTFTGSTAVGRKIMVASAESNLKRFILELGGKSPNIVFDDVEDLDQVVEWSHFGVFLNAGQICYAGTRILVQDTIYDKFVEKFCARARQAKLGDPFDASTTQGPQISPLQCDRILSYIESGKSQGATLALGGKRFDSKGYFIEPTVFTDTDISMKIMQEEIFGPVVCITKFTDEDDAIRKANSTVYGLAGAVHTSSLARAIKVSDRIESGTVWVNAYGMMEDVSMPFGGYHQSGSGRELGEDCLKHYTQVKSVKINIGKPAY